MPGDLSGIGLPCDPEGARQLLAEAGYPGGHGFTAIECCVRTGQTDLGENLQAQWHRNLGVKVEWETLEWQPILARLGVQLPHLPLMGIPVVFDLAARSSMPRGYQKPLACVAILSRDSPLARDGSWLELTVRYTPAAQ
jgi:ABC-type transport system substrate-binding protein